MSNLERDFQRKLIRKLKARMPDAVVLKNDANYLQGFPDLLVLFPGGWVALEVKRSMNAAHQPNQDYYISKLQGMSYAAFICPENEEDVLYEIQQQYERCGDARVSQS